MNANLLFPINRVARSQSDASNFFSKSENASATLPRHGFTRFEEKKRHNQEIRTTAVKSLFRKTPSKLGSPKSKDRRELSPESTSAIMELDRFLQTLPSNAAHHAYSFLKMHADKLDRLVSSGVLTPLEISDRVHNIYQLFDEKLKTHSGFLGMSLSTIYKIELNHNNIQFCCRIDVTSSSVEDLLDHSERYLTRILYRKLFCPPNCDDEERDLTVQKRIRSLNWISAPLLDCRINELDPKVRDTLEKAITRTFSPSFYLLCCSKTTSLCNSVVISFRSYRNGWAESTTGQTRFNHQLQQISFRNAWIIK